MNDVSRMARNIAESQLKALQYLDSCGKLTREKFVKVYQIAGGDFSQSQLEQMWDSIEIKIAMEGDEELRQMLRNTFQKGAAVFGYTTKGLEDISAEKKKWWKFW